MTGYDIFNMAAILVFGIPKGILSYRGQSVTPTTLDLFAGTILAVMYACILKPEKVGFFVELIVPRSYYGGLVKAKRPEMWPLFFQVDWASPILRFAWRSEGGLYSNVSIVVVLHRNVLTAYHHSFCIAFVPLTLVASCGPPATRAGRQTGCQAWQSRT